MVVACRNAWLAGSPAASDLPQLHIAPCPNHLPLQERNLQMRLQAHKDKAAAVGDAAGSASPAAAAAAGSGDGDRAGGTEEKEEGTEGEAASPFAGISATMGWDCFHWVTFLWITLR